MEIEYTKEQLIKAIKIKQKELGRTPTSYDFENIPIGAFYRVFNSWNDALKHAGFKPNLECNKYNKEKLIKILQETAQKLGRTPTTNDIKDPSKNIFIYTFGSWNSALKEACLKVNQKRKRKSIGFENITKIELVDMLAELMKNNDNKLTFAIVDKSNKFPSLTFILKIFEVTKWSTVIEITKEYLHYKSNNIDIPLNYFEKYIEVQKEKITDEEILNMLKNELERLNTTSQKIFDAKRNKNVFASSFIKRRFNTTWGGLLNLLNVPYNKYEYRSNKNRRQEIINSINNGTDDKKFNKNEIILNILNEIKCLEGYNYDEIKLELNGKFIMNLEKFTNQFYNKIIDKIYDTINKNFKKEEN